MAQLFAALGAFSAFASVAAGAFGAHALRQKLTADMLTIYETAARYQMYHALGLILLALALSRWPAAALQSSGWFFVAGTVLFCGSLYVLALTGVRWLGAITPFGGVAFLAGWLLFAWGAWSNRG